MVKPIPFRLICIRKDDVAINLVKFDTKSFIYSLFVAVLEMSDTFRLLKLTELRKLDSRRANPSSGNCGQLKEFQERSISYRLGSMEHKLSKTY